MIDSGRCKALERVFPSFLMRPFVLQLPPTTHLIRTHPLCALQLHGACSALGIHAARALLVSRPRPWLRAAMVHALLVSRCRPGLLHAWTGRGPDLMVTYSGGTYAI